MDIKLISQLLVPMYVTHFSLVLWYYFVKNHGLWDYPIDLNLKFIDGNRLVGDAKTIVGLLISFMVPTIITTLFFGHYHGLFIGAGLYLSALIFGFIKRRLGMKRGESLPIFDQTDCVFGAYLTLNIFGIIEYNPYFWQSLLLALFIHPLLVYIAYRLRLRTRPW